MTCSRYFSYFIAFVVLAGCQAASPAPARIQIEPTGNPPDVIRPAASITPRPLLTRAATPQATSTPDYLAVPPPDTPVVMHDNFYGERDTLYLRPEPHTLASVALAVNRLMPYDIIGRTTDNSWLLIRLENGTEGWILTRRLQSTVDTRLPVVADAVNVNNVLLLPADPDLSLTLYENTTADAIAELDGLTPLRIEAVTPDNQWWKISLKDGQQGWISPPSLDVDVSSVRTVTDAPAALQRAGDPMAAVSEDGAGLRLRQLPTLDGTILLNLRAGQALTVQGRTANNWLLVTLPESGYQGWSYGDYIQLEAPQDSIPLVDNPQPVDIPEELLRPPESAAVASGGGTNAREIYRRGQSLGNRRYIFTTVGDSLSDTPHFLRHIIYGYNLQEHAYLQPTLDFFNADTGYGNAFGRRSMAAHAGWSAVSALEPANADPALCQPDEIPVACEYRLTQPAVALIMIGTNDLPAFSPDTYRSSLTRILDISVEYGVVPVLSTLPPRPGYNEKVQAYNQVIRQLAGAYGMPLWDFHQVVAGLPNSGLDADGVHLSIPPGAPASTMNFTEANLQYGTTLRNLTALQMLDTVRKQILYD